MKDAADTGLPHLENEGSPTFLSPVLAYIITRALLLAGIFSFMQLGNGAKVVGRIAAALRLSLPSTDSLKYPREPEKVPRFLHPSRSIRRDGMGSLVACCKPRVFRHECIILAQPTAIGGNCGKFPVFASDAALRSSRSVEA